MGRIQVTGDQVADDTITTDDVKDGTIQRQDIDITTVGQSLPTRIIAGNRINITETGADSGTGDVTINAIDTQLIMIQGGISSPVFGSITYFVHDTVAMNEVPFLLPRPGRLRWFLLNVNQTDPSRTYRFRLRRNNSVVHAETLNVGQTQIAVADLNLPLSSGRYDLSLRKFGGGPSSFNKIWGAVGIQIRIQEKLNGTLHHRSQSYSERVRADHRLERRESFDHPGWG